MTRPEYDPFQPDRSKNGNGIFDVKTVEELRERGERRTDTGEVLKAVGKAGKESEGERIKPGELKGRGAAPVYSPDSYTASQIYPRAYDGRGHGEQMSFKVPQGWKGMMGRIVASLDGYDTIQDLARDAIVHRVDWWSNNEADPELAAEWARWVEQEKAIERVKLERQAIELNKQTLIDFKETFDVVLSDGAMSAYYRTLGKAKDVGEKMEEPWKGRMALIIEKAEDEAKRVFG